MSFLTNAKLGNAAQQKSIAKEIDTCQWNGDGDYAAGTADKPKQQPNDMLHERD